MCAYWYVLVYFCYGNLLLGYTIYTHSIILCFTHTLPVYMQHCYLSSTLIQHCYTCKTWAVRNFLPLFAPGVCLWCACMHTYSCEVHGFYLHWYSLFGKNQLVISVSAQQTHTSHTHNAFCCSVTIQFVICGFPTIK